MNLLSNKELSTTVINKDNILPKVVGESKHFPPAIKEWNNSSYYFNKTHLRSLPAKDEITKKIIKSYFYLSNEKDRPRSRRMRSLKRKFSYNKIFVSKPEIKQTNDKVIISMYTFNREKQYLLRKIFFFNRRRNILDLWRRKNKLILNKPNFSLVSRLKDTSIIKNYYKNKNNISLFYRKRKNMFMKKMGKRKVKRDIPYKGIKLNKEMNFFFFRLLNINKQFVIYHKLFYYYFMKYVLSMFKVKIVEHKKENLSLVKDEIKRLKRKNYLMFSEQLDNLLNANKIEFILDNKVYTLYLNKNEQDHLNKTDYIKRLDGILTNINFSISQLIDNLFIKSNVYSREIKLHHLFNDFYKKYFSDFITRKLKREDLSLDNYLKLSINNLKFGKFLNGLKMLISRIYDKKVELNIINLKYIQLNSDIFTESIAVKLKNKLGLLLVLKKALSLVKRPYRFIENTNKFDLNKIKSLEVYSYLNINNLEKSNYIHSSIENKDLLEKVIREVYPRSVNIEPKDINNTSLKGKVLKSSGKLMSILNSTRYKWITGVKLEAAGRLTKRFTASRSNFKFKYKGSLKNIDYTRKLDFLKKSMPTVMLRNQARANSQYTFLKSKRRVGAFGIKGWISSQ